MCKFAFLAAASVSLLAAAPETARDLIKRALEAQGGADRIRAIERVRFQATGYRNLLEQSERPEGPYIAEFQKIEELHDVAHSRFRRSITSHIATQPESVSTFLVSDGVAAGEAAGRKFAGSANQRDQALEALALGPERILLTALNAPDIRLARDEVLQNVPHHVLAFTWSGSPVRVFLNADTLLPTAVETSGAAARADYFAYLGGGTLRTYWSFWWLAKSGVRYPLQWDMEWNGLPARKFLIDDLKMNPADGTDWSVTPELKSQLESRLKAPAPHPQPGQEIAPDVVLLPGSWMVTLVKQSDGVVVLDAPISSGYSALAIEEAQRRWPGAAIKAVITTSDAWPHVAGLPEYDRRHIPIYALDVNRVIVTRVLGAAQVNWVAGPVSIGEGANRLDIYPLRGETSERQMMVYFPGHRLLYGSDAFQRDRDGTFFSPQTVSEVLAAVEREKLTPETYFMMHVAPAPWKDLAPAIRKAAETDSPTAK